MAAHTLPTPPGRPGDSIGVTGRAALWAGMLTTSGTIISSCFEIGLLHLMATRRLRHYTDFWLYPAWSLFHLLLVPYYVVSLPPKPIPTPVFGPSPRCTAQRWCLCKTV